ncbi:MAG: Hsp70 family protein [Cellulosilyticaceae bacterium]
MAFSVGIDLGTTNTVVSTARIGLSGAVEVLTEKVPQLTQDWCIVEEELLPSVLFVNHGERQIGKIAKDMKGQNVSRVIFNSKNFMGDENIKWTIDGQEYTPELVASYFLSGIRKHLLDKYDSPQDLKSAVITVPASFNLDQKNATMTAAKIAGFADGVVLISEPTAAVLDFINEQIKVEDQHRTLDFSETKKVAVFDLGGGTCDVAVLAIKMQGEEIQVEEVGVSQHTLVGGTNFDVYAINGVLRDYEKQHQVSLKGTLTEQNYIQLQAELNTRLEQIKMRFSGQYLMRKERYEDLNQLLEDIVADIQIPHVMNGEPFKFKLTMAMYNGYIKPLLSEENTEENIITPINEALRASKMQKSDIDYVFCVGGMTQYPEVKRVVSEYFERRIYEYCDTMNSVSRGASIYHHYKVTLVESGTMSQTKATGGAGMVQSLPQLIPALPQSVFMGVKNGFPKMLIEMGEKAGTPIVYDRLAKVSSSTGVFMELYSGLSYFDPKLKKLRGVQIDFPHGVKAGSDMSLKVEYTGEGILNIETWLSDTPEIKGVISVVGAELTDEEVASINHEMGVWAVGGMG